jgi:hypothetical protein
MLDQDVIVNKAKYYVYTLLGKIIPLIIIFMAIFVNKGYMIALLGISSINMLINSTEVKEIKSNGIFYLRKNIVAAKKIANINNDGIIYYKEKITSMLKSVKGIERSTRLIGVINMWGGFFEFISVIFLLEESAYYSISAKIKEEKKVLMDLFYIVGELEALISIAGYQHNLKQSYVEPKFIKKITLNIKEVRQLNYLLCL